MSGRESLSTREPLNRLLERVRERFDAISNDSPRHRHHHGRRRLSALPARVRVCDARAAAEVEVNVIARTAGMRVARWAQ